ncbi:MAG: DUF998 domain-containing protein [Ferruginibacter sp.]
MKKAHNINQYFQDPLKSFRTLQMIIAIICILIPAILKTFDDDEFYPEQVKLITPAEMDTFLSAGQIASLQKNFEYRRKTQEVGQDTGWTMQIHSSQKVPKIRFGFRQSVSDYVYGSNSYLFGLLYCMAAMLYIFNGVVYLNMHEDLKIQKNGNLYNIIIGLCLIGVVLYPHHVDKFRHNLFSFLFFILNIFVMIFFAKPDESMTFKIARITMGLLTLGVLLTWLCFHPVSLLWAEWISLSIISSYLFLMAKSVKRWVDPNVQVASTA